MKKTLKKRPALIWDRSNEGRPYYWQLPADEDHDLTYDHDETIYALSYENFNQLSLALSQELRRDISKHLKISVDPASLSDISNEVLSVPIAIAIPEGPYLPLTIAAVHALNVPFRFANNAWASAVLLPLDPSDARLRVIHMLQDICPAFVATASDIDYTRMREITSEITGCSQKLAREAIYRSSETVVTDVRELISKGILCNSSTSDALSRCQSTHISEKLCSETFDAIALKEVELSKCNRISHIVFTSGSTGLPKACVSSASSLQSYLTAKNSAHGISSGSTVLLASALTFDPCFSDVLATLMVGGTLALAPRTDLIHRLDQVIRLLSVTHILCTSTLWSTVSVVSDRADRGFPDLLVVALGGEHIPKRIINSWARSKTNASSSMLRLFSTFGVTEACVYQTFGEVFADEVNSTGQDVGNALLGNGLRICVESNQKDIKDILLVGYPDGVGEVVVYGRQLDSFSQYFQQPELTAMKFISENGVTHYRTGDRGYVDEVTNHLHILGRIAGESGMVKINGVRVELGEIEASLVDSQQDCVVVLDSIVAVVPSTEMTSASHVYGYIVLSQECLVELGISSKITSTGVICVESPLLTLLVARCKLKTTVVPSVFIIVPRIPLSATGKRYRPGVPDINDAVPLSRIAGENVGISSSIPLQDYGQTGCLVAAEVAICLNLRQCQISLMTTTSTFTMLGGDSLSATRVTRAIYARHHEVFNSRLIGGEYGIVEGPFAALHLLTAANLGDYVDWLDKNGVCERQMLPEEQSAVETSLQSDEERVNESAEGLEAYGLFQALLQATSSGSENIAMALLDVGADPNLGESAGRIGKTSGRLERMKLFRSGPLHLACLQGRPLLVKHSLLKHAKYNSPNASTLFPLHLAAAGEFMEDSTVEEDDRRLLCVQYLLEAGAPLKMRDGSQQTILHAAARAGHVKVLRFAIDRWLEIPDKTSGGNPFLDWRDSWSRTPVHWAVINGKVDALALLVEKGFSTNPPKPKESHRRTSAAMESPLEICSRMYSAKSDVGERILDILVNRSTS